MEEAKQTSLNKGEMYELACLLAIASCLWLIGETLGIFTAMQLAVLQNGLSSVVFLGFLMSFAFAAASALKSVRLRREMRAREIAEENAMSIARRDALTALPNRRMLIETIEAATAANPLRTPSAAFLIDLDRFKPVNDVYGHPAGDAVLCEVAERLNELLPKDAIAARLGGDEFSVFLPNDANSADLIRLAQQIITRLSDPILWEHAKIDIGATVGIALFPTDGQDAEALLRAADIAMYRGKREGRGTFRFFEQKMDEELKERVTLEIALRHAIQSGEIRPHYQPLVALPSHKLLGFEVLARWYHPQRGIISPDIFIPLAEDSGMITELCYGLLRQACADARSWPGDLGLSINISPYQFKDRLLAARILSILRETGFDARRLEIEITESALTNDIEVARATLGVLQSAGVSIALDDFGTGYSSLYHLRELKFDKIKIDRSFVQSLENQESAKIISAIIGLGQSLGILTTAEGIESTTNSEWLAARGCTYGQGFLFGPPVPASGAAKLIENTAPTKQPSRRAAA
ncbi:putative bifunctional diguanylate cyclase/phosphodiesterase [Enterovirga aerilata]|uniref:EAL domain-containing protein n=1 Tax=Enterovirga aerilata TaxID=2730920 RepID=A0A849IE66_9HYPH|nr:EAL domain-containing protein [Enterovirga sp. DB1703]NNM74515.1 EAL domain-containing protein [Enterovirga sp. DB1703]